MPHNEDAQSRHGPSIIIGAVPKGQTSKIQISIGDYEGQHFIDIRTAVPKPSGETILTKKGVTVPLSRLPALIDYLKIALDEAKRRNLF